jgi:hypothetical protein
VLCQCCRDLLLLLLQGQPLLLRRPRRLQQQITCWQLLLLPALWQPVREQVLKQLC